MTKATIELEGDFYINDLMQMLERFAATSREYVRSAGTKSPTVRLLTYEDDSQ